MFFIYSLLYSIVLLVLLPFEYLKRPKGLRSRWLRERFGFFGLKLENKNSKLIWIHAVSVGEVIAAVPFMRELKAKYPSIRIILSTVTDTGQKVAGERVSDIAVIVYLPFDLIFILKKVLKKTKPDLFVTLETELWPNILRLLKREGIPSVILNGRFSDNSFKGYKKIRFFIKDVVRCVDLFCMQNDIYKERIMELGADEERVKVIGNFKFDIRPSEKIPEWASFLKSPVIVAGSTHEGEDELIIGAYKKLRNDFPDLNLVMAPRHPERFGYVGELIRTSGLPFIKRSELSDGKDHGNVIARSEATKQSQQIGIASPEPALSEKMRFLANARNDRSEGARKDDTGLMHSGVVFLLDTIGELASAYGIADVVIMGGSFINHGGHNPLEAAFWGKSVVCGPHMENFPFIDDFYKEGGAVKSDAQRLGEDLRRLLESPEDSAKMGKRAKTLYDEKAGAVNRAVEMLKRYLEPRLLFS